jgi:hypothetical protein
MTVEQWSKSELEYGKKVWHSGLEGARAGREAFLHGRSLTPFFYNSVRKAVKPAAIVACIGMVAGCCEHQRQARSRSLIFGLVGGAIGFCAGLAWESRSLTASVMSGAACGIDRVRDEHWFETHPIDYA